MVVNPTSRVRTLPTALTVPGQPLVEAKDQNFARNLLQVHSLGPQQGVARGAEEVALPPLTPPPLPSHRYRRRTSSSTRLWRPAPPREHLFPSPRGFRGALCSVCRVCGDGAFLGLCWSVCACSLVPAGHSWVNRCVLGERSTMRACLVESCVAFRSRSRPVDRVLPVRCMCSDTCLCAATDIIYIYGIK